MFSRFVFFIFIFPVLLVPALETVATAEGLSWTLHKSPRNDSSSGDDSDELHIAVTALKTEISSSNKLLFIDYSSMDLYRFDRLSKQCSVFDLKGTEPNEIVKKTVSRLAEFSVKESTEKQDIKEFHCARKTVLLGAGMFRLKTFGPKMLERYGQSFREAVAEYWVSQDVRHWKMLQGFILQRQAAFGTQPLLKRLDPLGLIEAVGGFPVQGWQKTGGVRVDFTLLSAPETGALVLQPPQGCKRVSGPSSDVK